MKKELLDIYNRLLSHYGPQHWWPAQDPFEVMVGAILTQSTAWSNVEKAIANLKEAGALSPESLSQLPLSELTSLVYPSCYYNTKAHKLKALAAYLAGYDNDLKKLFKVETGQLRRELLEVHGIGEETADSILLYAANRPVFVIDAYTRRILGRAGLKPERERYQDYQSLFMENLSADAGLFNEYHGLLVCLGKNACRKNPLCEQCCLGGEICNFQGSS